MVVNGLRDFWRFHSRVLAIGEFLHGTQDRLGIINRLGVQGAENHVTEFMIRHSKLLGLEP